MQGAPNEGVHVPEIITSEPTEDARPISGWVSA